MNPPWIRSNIPWPTAAGWAVLVLALVSATAGLKGGNNFLFFTGGLLAGIWLACGVRSGINLRNLRVERTVSYPMFAGSSAFTFLRIENAGRFMHAGLLRVRDAVEGRGAPRRMPLTPVARIPGRSHAKFRQLVKFSRRGEIAFKAITVESTFPLGLFRTMRIFALPGTAVIFPRIISLPPALLAVEKVRARGEALLVPTARGDEEFAGLREFRPGDNPKWIHWKSSARGKGRLLVKELEGIMPRRVKIVLDNTLPVPDIKGRIRFERAVRVAASLAHALATRRFIVNFHITGDDAQFVVASHGGGLYRLLHALALLEHSTVGRQEGERPPDPGMGGLPCMVIRPDLLSPDQPLERVLTWE